VFASIAACRLGRSEFDIRTHEPGAKAPDLLSRGLADIESMGDRAEAACAWRWLEARQRRAEGDHLRRLDTACGRGQQNVERAGALEDRSVARDCCLRRQGVHALGARRPGQALETEMGDGPRVQGTGTVAISATQGDENTARPERLRSLRRPDLHQQLRAADDVVKTREAGAGLDGSIIRKARVAARIALD
jgi:hypothetical protein